MSFKDLLTFESGKIAFLKISILLQALILIGSEFWFGASIGFLCGMYLIEKGIGHENIVGLRKFGEIPKTKGG